MSPSQELTTNVTTDIIEYNTIPVPDKTALKQIRLKEVKAEIESKLQHYIAEAAAIRQKSSTAKTAYKRQFYEKKFAKINKAVRQSIVSLQQIQYLLGQQGEETDASNVAQAEN